MTEEHVPVLVVGAGTVGLSTAVALTRHGVRPLVVERRDGTLIHPRATGLHPPAREFFRAVGVADRIAQVCADLAPSMTKISVSPSLAAADLSTVDRVPTPPLDVVADTLRLSPTTVGPCAQDQIDIVLAEAAVAAGARIRFAAKVCGLHQDDDGVTVRLVDPTTGRGDTVRARYVVGADGASSRVRRELGVRMPLEDDLANPMIHILFRADLADLVRGHEFNFCEVWHPDHEGLLLSIDNKTRWVFHRSYDAARESPEDYPEQRCAELVRGAVGIPDLDVTIEAIMPWRISGGCAERMRRGRVFLAGDSAHVVPPVGGFGMTTGISDAYNLAWKLGMVLDGHAGPGLLDTYEEERLPVARFACEQGLNRLRAMMLTWDPRPEEEKERERAGLRIAAPLVTSMGYDYRSAAVVGARTGSPSIEDVEANLDGSPGSRVPHAWVERAGERVSTLDFAGTGFALIAGQAAGDWAAASEKAAAATGIPLTAHRAGVDFTDPGGAFATAAGIGPAGALLVRPDNFVAWRSTGPHPEPDAHLHDVLHTLMQRG
ncbi:FAD-dependent monooxygenase [Saccharothrix australiensis]|uniref:2-polyprenyl-6-methoxyphenol hydroxylase-like FAD-dependent oxidoreductase n=1 Tax=Saccharothrix australiensis TaxID=2072 RepID=A0A495W4N8_9PSEU|nr:FAD-dependent monooxygenase [Saccharothrix australiensis]RKT55623.1 2-polyprenyl-6-methoxyphenol hydroxylase-like FAD-dependent oxidoreductase [Saccharothrix australiensis]